MKQVVVVVHADGTEDQFEGDGAFTLAVAAQESSENSRVESRMVEVA